VTNKPMWQELSITRHENEAVLTAIRYGDRVYSAVSTRTGLGMFKVALVIRRLERAGLVDCAWDL
jgi:hypothetical protein